MPYSFVEDEEKIKQEPLIYKPIDRTIKQKFETEIYRRAMIDILFEHYKLYISEGLIIPESVKNYTNNYFGTQSILGWFNNNYKENEKSKINIDVIQEDYKNEFNITMSKKDLRDKLTGEGLCIVCIKGYYYVKGFIREEKIEEYNLEDDIQDIDQIVKFEDEESEDEDDGYINPLDRL